MHVCLLGASGLTGRLIARELAARGRAVIACGRDAAKVRDALAPLGEVVVEVRELDLDAPDTVRAAMEGADAAISAIGPYDQFGHVVVDAAIAAGVPLTDVSGEQAYTRWVHEQRHAIAVREGVTLVPAAGLTGGVGTLLAAVAADVAGSGARVHITYTTAGAGGPSGVSAGTRRSAARALGQPSWAYRDGELVPEPLGEDRRLAWFPRPVGPMHAAAVPGVEAVALPRHLAELREIHTYLAMSTWKAEALQAIVNASRREPIRRRLVGWLGKERGEPSDERRAATRWACVAEAHGGNGLARAWAYGRDPYTTAAIDAAEVSAALGTMPAGVWPVAAVGPPAELLDRLAATSGLRWSVVRPDAGASTPGPPAA